MSETIGAPAEAAPAPPVGGSWHTSKTVWASVAVLLLALPSLVEQVAPFLDEKARAKALAFAAIAATLASLFARKGGVDAAKAVAAVAVDKQASRLLPGVLAALADKLEERTDGGAAVGNGAGSG